MFNSRRPEKDVSEQTEHTLSVTLLPFVPQWKYTALPLQTIQKNTSASGINTLMDTRLQDPAPPLSGTTPRGDGHTEAGSTPDDARITTHNRIKTGKQDNG